MISVANRIFVTPEYASQFEERFKNRPRMVDGRPGFISNHVMRPTKPGEPYVVLTFWESLEAFRAWTTSADFKDGHKGGVTLPPEAFSAPNVVEVHEVFTGSGS